MRLWTHELSSPFASEHCSSRIVGRCLHVSSLLVPGLRDHDNHFKPRLSPLRGACERDRQRLLFGRAGRKGLSIMRDRPQTLPCAGDHEAFPACGSPGWHQRPSVGAGTHPVSALAVIVGSCRCTHSYRQGAGSPGTPQRTRPVQQPSITHPGWIGSIRLSRRMGDPAHGLKRARTDARGR